MANLQKYDRGLVYSPSGDLVSITYANKNISKSRTVIAVKVPDGVKIYTQVEGFDWGVCNLTNFTIFGFGYAVDYLYFFKIAKYLYLNSAIRPGKLNIFKVFDAWHAEYLDGLRGKYARVHACAFIVVDHLNSEIYDISIDGDARPILKKYIAKGRYSDLINTSWAEVKNIQKILTENLADINFKSYLIKKQSRRPPWATYSSFGEK